MPDEAHAPGAPEHGHGEDDVNVRIIVWFAVGLIVLAVLIHVGVAWMYFLFLGEESREKKSDYPLAAEERREGPSLPEGPVLEGFQRGQAPGAAAVSTPEDLHEYRLLDPKKAIWAVPVDQVFDRVLRDGVLKMRKGKQYTWKKAGEQSPSQASSGHEVPGGTK
jgi:hypothetical protein